MRTGSGYEHAITVSVRPETFVLRQAASVVSRFGVAGEMNTGGRSKSGREEGDGWNSMWKSLLG